MDGGAREIPLTKGRVAIVDAADYEWLSQWKWCAQVDEKGFAYACRAGPRLTIIRMHRVLAQPAAHQVVDHINRDTLDNRRANLRCCTLAENARNRAGNRGTLSPFKGVLAAGPRWRARIGDGTRQRHLGCFATQEEAARAYDEAARLLHGEFARLNFPEAS